MSPIWITSDSEFSKKTPKNNDSKQIVLATNLSELLTLKKYLRGFLQVFAISLLCQKIKEFI